MGKLVKFQRGIATVIPDCVSGTVSQNASPGDFSTVCELQTLKAIQCHINQRLPEAPAGVPSHCSPCLPTPPSLRRKRPIHSKR